MNRNIQILGKCATIVAFFVSVIVLLPEVAFGKGAVIGYASGDCGPVSDEQLDRLTHVMAVDLYPDANSFLCTCKLPDS